VAKRVFPPKVFTSALAGERWWFVRAQCCPDFWTEFKKIAEGEEEASAFDGSDKLQYVLGWPASHFTAIHHVFRYLSEVVTLSHVHHFDDGELLPDQSAPRSCDLYWLNPIAVNQPVAMEMPSPCLVGYLYRDATPAHPLESFGPSHLREVLGVLLQLRLRKDWKITLRKNEVLWLLQLRRPSE
jgi:hypothetical protein